MSKIKLLIEYDGTSYQGWQIQKKGETIQGIIENRVLMITGESSRVIGASRTDAGVHALGQVAVFRTRSELKPEIIKKALNAVLPQDIRILDASIVEDSFHPRKNAVKKSYFFVISNQRESSAFLYKYVWMVQQALDLKKMEIAAQEIVGKHDFSSFMGTGSSIKNPVREIFSLGIYKLEKIDFLTMSLRGNFIKIRIEADGFLRHMVRNIVGTIVEIGKGKISEKSMREILAKGNRKFAGPTAPPNGLFLEKIIY